MTMKAGNCPSAGNLRGLGLIARAMAQNRISHAYLVTGPPGAGKKQLVEKCAVFLLCQDPDMDPSHPSACGTCSSCRKFQRGVHPDFLELKPQGRYIKIDQVRSMQNMIAFAPLEGKRRVVSIVSADKLNINASNALLKTLEEPPENTHLFLAAASSSRLLATIVSRCQALPLDQEKEVLGRNFASPASDQASFFLEYVSRCSRELSGKMLEDGILEIRETLFSFLCSGKKKELFFHTSQRIGRSRQALDLSLTVLNTVTRDLLLLLSSDFMQDRHLINLDKASELIKLAHGLNYDSLMKYRKLLEKAERYLERNVNPGMIADALLIFWIKEEHRY